MMRLDERAAATAAVIARFRARPFGWEKGGTCIHLARAQMRALGHRPPAIPRFYSAVGARRALEATGFKDLSSLLDSLLPRIAPAAMWVGDLAVMDSGEGDLFDAIVVSTGQTGSGAIGGGQMMAGYHADHLGNGIVNIIPREFNGAWRL
jgi:hypothetical protein